MQDDAEGLGSDEKCSEDNAGVNGCEDACSCRKIGCMSEPATMAAAVFQVSE